MPYLQFEIPGQVSPEKKKELALLAGALYARMMGTTASMVKVAFRNLGPDNLFRLRADGETLEPVVVIQCDVRRGRAVAERQAFATALSSLAAESLGVLLDAVEIEFTQHAGDEMFRRGRFTPDWSPGEAPTGESPG